MTLKVIGAGLGRTGTLSLKLALEQLGIGRCFHMIEIFGVPGLVEQWERAGRGEAVSWDAMFEGFEATVDWPSCSFYDVLAARYPAAKVILTLRDAGQWFESTQKTIFKDLEKAVEDTENPWARMVKRIIVDMFEGRIHDREHAIAAYNAHNERVRRTIPPERLLVYDVREGWEPLCRFLGEPVPAMPFPRANSAEDFPGIHERIAAKRDGG